MELQKGLRDVAQRRLEEGRDPPPPVDEDMEKAWAAMEKAAADLADKLGRQKDKLARDAACAETDKLQKANEDKARPPPPAQILPEQTLRPAAPCPPAGSPPAHDSCPPSPPGTTQAAKWLKEVEDKSKDFGDKVANGELGSSPDETQKLLDALRNGFQEKEKPELAKTKAGLEGERRDVDARRAAEEREPAAWTPTNDALSSAWKAMGENERAYEQAQDTPAPAPAARPPCCQIWVAPPPAPRPSQPPLLRAGPLLTRVLPPPHPPPPLSRARRR